MAYEVTKETLIPQMNELHEELVKIRKQLRKINKRLDFSDQLHELNQKVTEKLASFHEKDFIKDDLKPPKIKPRDPH